LCIAGLLRVLFKRDACFAHGLSAQRTDSARRRHDCREQPIAKGSLLIGNDGS